MSKTVAIIDYSLGNLFSVQQAFAHFGVDAVLAHDQKALENADAIVLPGVGAFGEAMKNLERLDLIDPIHAAVKKGKPFMGICLGLQLLFESSEEFGNAKGLGLIKGSIKKFSFDDKNIKVPQMGWNAIAEGKEGIWNNTPLKDVKPGELMYFVHSYYANASDEKDVLCKTDYEGKVYCSAVLRENIFATQFHPEKSAAEGLKIYKNWINTI